ncbi:unnamed protein product, partial [Phaeothamnion confervicola]
KAAKARGAHLRVHYKHCREVSHAIQGLSLAQAKKFLEDVLDFKRAVPFTMFTGGIGRHAQAKVPIGKRVDGKGRRAPGDKCAWPQKATRIILNLVKNAESNAEMKGLDLSTLFVTHVQANRAPKQRRRTYRAHGRINAYMSSPAHIELVLAEKLEHGVKRERDEPAKLSRKQQARKRIKEGGGDAIAEI